MAAAVCTVTGRVLVHETGEGVRDLVVAALDADFYDWEQRRGSVRRIGSTLTGDDGTFRMEFDTGTLRLSGAEERPDLLLVVLAPHVGTADHPSSPPEPEQPLYTTAFPRMDVGGQEAFVVRLPQSRLAELGLAAPPTKIQRLRMVAPASSGDGDRAPTAPLTGTLWSARRQVELDGRRLAEIRSESQRVANWLVARPSGRADARRAHADVSADVDIERTVGDGLRGLSSLTDRVRGVRLRVDRELLAAVSDEFEVVDGQLVGAPETVDVARLMAAIQGRGRGGALEQASDSLKQCRARRVVASAVTAADGQDGDDRDVTPASDGDDGASGEGGDGSGGAPADVEPLLRQRLADVLSDGPSGDGRLPVRPDADAVAEDLRTELSTGPADATADHDFHSLQIAWRDVWAAAFDEELAGEVAALYEEAVALAAWRDEDDEVLQRLREVSDLETLVRRADTHVNAAAERDEAPVELLSWLPEIGRVWQRLTDAQRLRLRFLWTVDRFVEGDLGLGAHAIEVTGPGAVEYLGLTTDEFPDAWIAEVPAAPEEGWADEQARRLLAAVPDEQAASIGRARRLLTRIHRRLAEPYRFDVFAPGSYNYGLMTTYRQRWQPISYQVGELVATIPLAPGEKRTFTSKQVVKRSRAQREVETAVASRSEESTTTARADAEIVRKASWATNFSMSAEGSVTIEGIADLGGRQRFQGEVGGESAATKRDVREAVRKAASDYRSEHTTEVATEESVSAETLQSGELANPNSELTVTYLFYELERRYRVSERLHRVTPVVLVALDVPSPQRIDEDWLLAHEWILRRVLLDDRLADALDHLTDSFTGDEVGIALLRSEWEAQLRVVQELQGAVSAHLTARALARRSLGDIEEDEAREGIVEKLAEWLFGSNDAPLGRRDQGVADVAEQALEWAEADLTRSESKVTAAVEALRRSTAAYVRALRRQLNRRPAIDQLRVHVKENILYYMQAVWAHEPPDQRYFRLYDRTVRVPQARGRARVRSGTSEDLRVVDGAVERAHYVHVQLPPADIGPERELHEVADLDRLLGFKGNYAIFPLRAHNALTDFMAQDYLDADLGLVDPDPRAGVLDATRADELAACFGEHRRDGPLVADLRDALARQLAETDVVVVPSGQLFIEALPGVHPLLEDFKLRHRATDVARAHAEVQATRLENLRLAARLHAGERGDPDTERTVIVDTDVVGGVHVDPH